MAAAGFESLTGLRKQIIENCYFFTTTPGDISLIIAHEPIGTYKAIVLSETRRCRDVLLSSDSFDTVAKTFEHLFVKSTDAVQQYISANNFRRLPSDIDNDDDDGLSSVSSSVDEPDKHCLGDSSLSLESGLESAYESLSEDGDDTVSHSRVRTGRRSRSHCVRTVRRDSLSPSRSRSRSCSRSRDPTRPCRKAPAPPSRFTLHNDPVHRSRAVDPPQPCAGPSMGSDTANARFPTLPLRFSKHPSQMPPMPEQGLMSHGADTRGPSDPCLGSDAHMNGASVAFQQRTGANQQLREENKRDFQEGHRISAEFIELNGKAVPQPGRWPQLYPGSEPRPYMAPRIPTQMPWSVGHQRFQSMPHQQPLPPNEFPPKNMHQMGKPPPPPSALSSASSSASTTPTITISSNAPPEYSSGRPPASIDYRLVIKTPFIHTLDVRSGHRLDLEQPQEHRIIARTPPTRSDMRAVALRYIQQNPLLFPYVKGVSKGTLRAVVTRAVFNAGQGREESYDLGAYGEQDFSTLCEIMKRAGDEKDRSALPPVSGWPLFEIVVSDSGH